ncbi:hypothetical protein BGW80DRAFT_1275694 [Lactifluus volemus]|nr:hypothetical protein BGW80DRAFT_1275694 [Lactifluus volemus]
MHWKMERRLLTAVWIVRSIVVHSNGASSQLPLWLNVRRNAPRDIIPLRHGCSIIHQYRRRQPYRRKGMEVLRRRRIEIRRALEGGIAYLSLGLFRSVVLGEDRCGKKNGEKVRSG